MTKIYRVQMNAKGMPNFSTAEEVDAVSVVRCKECKHRYNDGWIEPRWTCDYLKDMRLKDDDYCSYGERSDI